jgi:2-polyprenyl-3-methyl-5-hydroxy-6-metoxy-1,4-benzoquinol methylase
MSIQEEYSKNQISHYKELTDSIERAKKAVAPNFEELSVVSVNYANLVIDNYLLRVRPQKSEVFSKEVFNANLRILDFGCGVGRVMEGYIKAGVSQVDGVDISQEMLEYAKLSPYLKGSEFYLSNGVDLGEAKKDYYDVISAFLVMHHIPMRQTRIDIVKAMYDSLNASGMIFLEYKIFPGITKNLIPRNHASWMENRPAEKSNSECDVWITPEELGYVYADLRIFFKDIVMIEMDDTSDKFNFQSENRYQYGFNSFYIAASKEPRLKQKLNDFIS